LELKFAALQVEEINEKETRRAQSQTAKGAQVAGRVVDVICSITKIVTPLSFKASESIMGPAESENLARRDDEEKDHIFILVFAIPECCNINNIIKLLTV
jgi:hypothetical protein